MSSNLFESGRQAARPVVLVWAGVAGALTLAACTGQPGPRPAPPAALAPASEEPAAEGPQTVTEAAAEVPDEPGTTTVLPDAGAMLKSGAPKDYVVKRGDTLWGIANLFLKDPWAWPEIWYVNPEIRNPHRIYPGDTVHLALRGDGRVALQVVHAPSGPAVRLEPLLRSSALEGPIATIPYSAIAAFLSRPTVLTRSQVDSAPYVLALRDDHQVAGTGHELYVRKLSAAAGTHLNVMHVDETLRDPDSGRNLGYLAIYTGTVQVTRPGRVAEAVLTDSARETLRGDVLVPEENVPNADFVPHVPARPINGRIIAAVDNVLMAGQYEVVALNRGAADGLERGNVLSAEQSGGDTTDHCAAIESHFDCGGLHSEKLPDETEGTLLVFKTYDRMSYALILGESVPIHVGDRVRSP